MDKYLKDLLKYFKHIERIKGKETRKYRFRTIKRTCIDYSLKLLNQTIARINFDKNNIETDILVVLTCDSSYSQTKHIWDQLKLDGYNIKFVKDTVKELIKATLIEKVNLNIPSKLVPFAAFSKLINRKYNPNLICMFTHYNVLPSFVKHYSKVKTLYIPHAIIDSTYMYSNQDFDYYMIFGESSELNIKENPLTIGKTRFLKVGSPVIKKDSKLEVIKPNNKFLFFSTWIIGEDAQITFDFRMMLEWIKTKPSYTLYIKLHPMENEAFVKKETKGIENIFILMKSTTIKEALEKVSAVLINFSVASVEAALMNRPSIVINSLKKDTESKDFRVSDKYLYIENFFPKRARNIIEIQESVNTVFDNYDHFIKQCEKYTSFHIERTTDSSSFVLKTIKDIYYEKI